MPLYKRKPLEKEQSTHQALKDNQEVFFCELSKEIFVDYEEYFERTMLFNSTIWTCAVSGRPNLTYAEALESERKHRKLIEAFPQILKGPCVYIANLTKRSAISDLVDDVFNYVNPRYFKGEIVAAKEQNTEQFVDCEVVGFVTATANGNSPNNNKADNSEDVKYRVKRIDNGKSPAAWVVNSDQLRRKKKKDQSHPFSKDKLKLFLKQCIEYNDIRMLRIKEESYKKYVTDANITSLSDFFVGKQPVFELSKMLADKKEKDNKKKQDEQKKTDKKKAAPKVKSEKKKTENDDVTNGMTASTEKNKGKQTSLDQFVTKDATKLEELKQAKKLEEEETRKRKEQEAERQKQLTEERKKHLAEMLQLVQATVKNMNALKDDLELQDQKPLPNTRPVRTLIPDKYFADALMVQEFIYSYTEILEDKDKFRNGIDLDSMERALLTREVAGPLSDIMQVLLGSIFSFQIEELNEINIEYEKGIILFKDGISKEQKEIVKHATAIAHWPKKYLSSNICDLPIDATTLTELLRLHFLTSGARLNEAGTKYRFQERGGYHNTDDPGVIFRLENPHILKALAEKTVYELPLDDIIAILRCLVNQALTYPSLRDIIEERLEKSTKAKISLRVLCAAERKRETTLAAEKKEILEEVKKNLEAFTGTDEEKAAYKENLDKDADNKIKRLEYVAEKDKGKFLSELGNLKREIFNYQLYLGSDRAYRSYWLFESLPGLFIEHAPFGGQCIENPVQNIHGLAYCAPEKRYLFIKNMLHSKQRNNNVNDKENKIVNMLEVKPKINNDANKQLPTDQAQPPLPQPPPPPPPEPEINMNLTQRDLLMCTGQSETCPVHSTFDADRSAWSFLHTEEEITALIDSLNPRGYREKNLKEQLESQKDLIFFHIKNCPSEKLQIEPDSKHEKIEQLGTDKGKTYQNANFNYPKGVNISEILLNEIRANILELEFKVTAGQLGTLRVRDRISWRQSIENGLYSIQCAYLQWGPFGQFQEDLFGTVRKVQMNGKISIKLNGIDEEDIEEDDENDDNSENGILNLTYEDPGDGLEAQNENGDTKVPKIEENEKKASTEYKKKIHKLACALLQIAQGIDTKYFKPPFGNLKSAERKNKELETEKSKRALEMWSVSLMHSFTPSQLFLHYNVLYDAIKWTRSAQNAKCVCRSSRDPDKLLLCDGCNIGRHIYCLKPKLTKVPEGDWFCSRCNPNKDEPQKKRRKTFVYTEDSEEETQQDEAEESESDSSGIDHLFSDSATQDSDTEKKVCVRCNKASRNLFKCSKCERYYDTKCLNLKTKPGRNWSCDVCSESSKRKIFDDDSDDEVLATKSAKLNGSLPNEERRSSRRKVESSPPNKRLNSSRRSRLSIDLLLDNVVIHKLLEEIAKHANSWPFVRPVSRSEVPDYYKVIKNPMDLAKIKSKLNMGKYSSNYEVMNDIQLIFENCDLYNQNDSDIYVAGADLETFIYKRCKEINLPFKPSDMISGTISSLFESNEQPTKKKKQK